MNRSILLAAVCAISPCLAASLDVPAVGVDLNGWQGNVARYSLEGVEFEVSKPITNSSEGGGLVTETVVREIKRSATVYSATIRLLIRADGKVQQISATGEIDGKSFNTGQVTRPEAPAGAAPESEQETADEGVSPVVSGPAPVDADAAMKEEFRRQLVGALERGRQSEKLVKRDLASRLWSMTASSDDRLASGTQLVLHSLFKRAGR